MSVTPVGLFSDGYTTLNSVENLSSVGSVGRAAKNLSLNAQDPSTVKKSGFDTILNAAIDMYRETDSLQKSAESSEMSFALGYTDSIHDLALAQQKANISLQYTVKVTNTVVQAYKELMQMQL